MANSTMSSIFSIDPGTVESAYTIIDSVTLKVRQSGKVDNQKMLGMIKDLELFYMYGIDHFVVEMVAGMGMRVGAEVFETAFWIGRFWEAMQFGIPKTKIYRKDEKSNLLGTQKGKDSDIISALVDRFTPDEPNFGKGTASHHGWFYGFAADIWQAYAVAVTYHDMYLSDIYKNKKAAREAAKKGNKKNGKNSRNN